MKHLKGEYSELYFGVFASKPPPPLVLSKNVIQCLLKISGNPLNCDCHMIWFAALSSRHIKCNARRLNRTSSETERPDEASQVFQEGDDVIGSSEAALPSCHLPWVIRMQNMSLGGESVVRNSKKTQCSRPERLLGYPVSVAPVGSMVCGPKHGGSTSSTNEPSRSTTTSITSICIIIFVFFNCQPIH